MFVWNALVVALFDEQLILCLTQFMRTGGGCCSPVCVCVCVIMPDVEGGGCSVGCHGNSMPSNVK